MVEGIKTLHNDKERYRKVEANALGEWLITQLENPSEQGTLAKEYLTISKSDVEKIRTGIRLGIRSIEGS